GQYSDDCCDQISDLEIMTDSTWSGLTMPTYSFGNDFIFIPEQGLAESPPFYQNVDLASNEKVVAHEAAHHIQAHLNTNIFLKRINGDHFSGSVIEGVADTLTALFAEEVLGEFISEAWVMGEDVLFPNYVRDLTIGREFSDYVPSMNSIHENGMIIGNLFFRIYQTGVERDELIQMILHVFREMSDGPTTGSFSWGDLKTWLDDFATDVDPALQAVVDSVWSTMQGQGGPGVPNPPGQPGGSGHSQAPDAPTGVSGSFQSCPAGGLTQGLLDWNQVTGGYYYPIFYSDLNQNIVYAGSALEPPVLVFTPYDTTWYVMACNLQNQCSGLSAQSYFQAHVCP
ncbi:MAG: hypothetical protein JJT88_20820, partial [Gammaproteobacteria bacterium]|nr:hypothetical protein [Gammaproteobacteria bacterium]